MYGILISLAIVSCLILGEKLAKSDQFPVEKYWGAAFWAILCGIAGARLYHVLDLHDYYFSDPVKILYIFNGGMGIYGAILGGLAGASLYLKLKGERLLPWLDLMAVITPLGQAIGRWGNFFNLELFGKPTELFWGITIPPRLRPACCINNDIYHPLFLYESLLNLALFAFLLLAYTRRGTPKGVPDYKLSRVGGFFILSYMAGYGIVRFTLEFLRIDPWKVHGINVAQAISVFFVLCAVAGFFILKKKNRAMRAS